MAAAAPKMAKKKKQAKSAAAPEAGSLPAAGSSAGSALELAWQAFARGDMVTARQACAQVLSSAPTPKDAAFAATIAAELFGRKDAPTDAGAVAAELKSRTEPPKNAYLFGALTAFIFAVLLLIARRG